MAYYQVTTWCKDIYRITSREDVFMELIVGEDKALLLDTGIGFGDLYDTVRGITDKPLVIVNSHGHYDHVGGNYQFSEDFYIHPKDAQLPNSLWMRQLRKKALAEAEEQGLSVDKTRCLFDGAGKMRYVEEGMCFALGGKTLEVVELPGHTMGSIGLLLREEKVLYTGDAINGALLLFAPESTSLEEYIATLKKAKNIDFTKMIQAHRPEIFEKSVLDDYIEVATSVDWEKTQNFPMSKDPDIRVMCKKGQTLADLHNPDFIALVVGKNKL